MENEKRKENDEGRSGREKRGYNNDANGDRSYKGGRGDRPRYNNGGGHSHGDGDRPRYNNGGGHSHGDGDRPRYNNGGGHSHGDGDRPRYNNGGGRSYGDGDRPRYNNGGGHSHGDGDRPRYNNGGGHSHGDGDRPRYNNDGGRSFGDGDRPRYNNGGGHSFGDGDERRGKKPVRLKGSEEIIQHKIKSRRNRQASPEPKFDGTTRLNKYISNAGICSRRDADKLIEAGAVSVNGEVVTTLGYKVKEGDVVSYGGEVLRSEPKRYFLLNKPKGFITTLDDPQERQTVMALVQGCCRERIYPVGRLDKNTTGLLLFTNDGEMTKKLTHPSSRVYKIYQVECDRPVTRNDMQSMLDGIELEDGPIAVDDVQYQGDGKDKHIVGVALHSGKNRIVRRIFEHFGYEVRKLDRVVFAGLTKKDLPRGRYRELTQQEVNYLMMI